MPKIKIGTYRHYKGNLYKVIGIAKHSETLEDFVVYESLYQNPKSKFWIRPYKMFFEKIEIKGEIINRFEFIKP